MRRLTILVASPDPQRLIAALEVAAAAAALDQPVRMFFQGPGVALLADPGLLFAEAQALGVAMIACQTGLSDAALPATALPEGVKVGGLVSLLADAGDDRMLMA